MFGQCRIDARVDRHSNSSVYLPGDVTLHDLVREAPQSVDKPHVDDCGDCTVSQLATYCAVCYCIAAANVGSRQHDTYDSEDAQNLPVCRDAALVEKAWCGDELCGYFGQRWNMSALTARSPHPRLTELETPPSADAALCRKSAGHDEQTRSCPLRCGVISEHQR